MRNMIFGVLVAMSTSACVTGPSYRIEQGWVKEHVDQTQAKQTLYNCAEKAKAAAERVTQVDGLTESCMALEGFAWGEYRTALQ